MFIKSLKTKMNKSRFLRVAEQARRTAPIPSSDNAEIVLLSQVYHGAVDMALLALKSFAYQIGQCAIEIVDDGTLTKDDKSLFEKHFPGLTITHIDKIDVGMCPRGGTWERLIRILQLSRERYVIQVDTDTLTLAAIPDIVETVSENRAFTIGNPIFDFPVSPEYMSMLAKRWEGNHVQVETERVLSSLQSEHFKHYCRGCSALAGFPVNGPGFEKLEAISQEMEQRLGKEKWYEWGSEQVASNLMVSLTYNPKILPWPKFGNYGFPSTGQGNDKPENFVGKVSVLHFIGSHRFSTRVYEKLSQYVITQFLRQLQ